MYVFFFSSTKRLEKIEAEDERPRVRRPASPTLPDGDLPSYMKATESYFKKVFIKRHGLAWIISYIGYFVLLSI